MSRTVLGQFIIEADRSTKKKLPTHTPIYHLNEDCYCNTSLANFTLIGRQNEVSKTSRSDDETAQDSHDKPVTVSLNLQAFPTIKQYPYFGSGLYVRRAEDGSMERVLDYNPGPFTTTVGSTKPVSSGGFLSLHSHSTRNVYYCTKDTYVTRIVYYTHLLGGPCGAWNDYHLFIAESDDIVAASVCGLRMDMPSPSMWQNSVGAANNTYVGCDKVSVPIAPLMFKFDPPVHLKAGYMYSIHCTTSPMAALGQLGTARHDPPWGVFIKAVVGEEDFTYDCGYDWYDNFEQSTVYCDRAFKMTIYTTDDVEEDIDTIQEDTEVTGSYNSETGVWVFD